MCGYEIDASGKSAKAYPFNFYIMPYFEDMLGANFASEPSALRFLAGHSFDFNRLFYEGVNYLSLEKERILRQQDQLKKAKSELVKQEMQQNASFLALYNEHKSRLADMVTQARSDRSKTV